MHAVDAAPPEPRGKTCGDTNATSPRNIGAGAACSDNVNFRGTSPGMREMQLVQLTCCPNRL